MAAEQKKEYQQLSISAKLEVLLFTASGAVSKTHLANTLQISTNAVEKALAELEESYAARGLRLQRHRGRVQLTTSPDVAPLVETFLGLEATSRLTKAALEALAIVAYQQPVTRPQIDAIRGVNSDSVLKSLLSKGLLQEAGRAPGPGRPILYETTSEFLQHFGLNSVEELPPLSISPDPSADSEEADILAPSE
jgi:segregation and condensation protein B